MLAVSADIQFASRIPENGCRTKSSEQQADQNLAAQGTIESKYRTESGNGWLAVPRTRKTPPETGIDAWAVGQRMLTKRNIVNPDVNTTAKNCVLIDGSRLNYLRSFVATDSVSNLFLRLIQNSLIVLLTRFQRFNNLPLIETGITFLKRNIPYDFGLGVISKTVFGHANTGIVANSKDAICDDNY